jgi:hypothetical protein
VTGGFRRRGAAALAAGLALAAALALVLVLWGADSHSDDKARPVGKALVGSVAPLAQCADWNRGSRDRRLATLADIREQVNLEDTAVKTPELSDRTAYRVLDNICRKPFARSFRLYKLYARAASFAALAED